MVLLSVPANQFSRATLLIHESFRHEQTALGLDGSDPAEPHLKVPEGRRWFLPELHAIATAFGCIAIERDGPRTATKDGLVRERKRAEMLSNTRSSPTIVQTPGRSHASTHAATAAAVVQSAIARGIRQFRHRVSNGDFRCDVGTTRGHRWRCARE